MASRQFWISFIPKETEAYHKTFQTKTVSLMLYGAQVYSYNDLNDFELDFYEGPEFQML